MDISTLTVSVFDDYRAGASQNWNFLIVTADTPKPTIVRRVIRSQIERIEKLLHDGYSVAAVRQMLGTEIGQELNHRSFIQSLHMVRKERKASAGHRVRPADPAPFAGTINRTSEAPTPVEPVSEPSGWNPDKKINPHLLRIRAEKARKSRNGQ